MKRQIAPRLALLLGAMVLGGCSSPVSASVRRHSLPVVDALRVRSGRLAASVRIAGIIARHRSIALSSSMAEPAKNVDVHEGGRVYAGEVLATLASGDLRAALAAAEQNAQMDKARAQQAVFQARQALAQDAGNVRVDRAALAKAQAMLAEDITTEHRYLELSGKGYISSQSLSAARTQVSTDRQAVAAAQASLESAVAANAADGSERGGLQAASIAAARAQARAAQARVAQLQRQIARATIRSPIDGIVVSRNLNPGEYPAGREMFTLQNIAHVYAVLDASSAQVFALRPGMDARVRRTDGPLGGWLPGVVRAVLPQTAPGSTNFAVKVDLANPAGRLTPGMPVIARIRLPAVPGTIIPVTAYVNDRHDSVLAVRRGRVLKLRVRERASDGRDAAVGGLPPGTLILTDGNAGVGTGVPVRIRTKG